MFPINIIAREISTFLFQLQLIFQLPLLNTKYPAAKTKTKQQQKKHQQTENPQKLQLDFLSEEHCY